MEEQGKGCCVQSSLAQFLLRLGGMETFFLRILTKEDNLPCSTCLWSTRPESLLCRAALRPTEMVIGNCIPLVLPKWGITGGETVWSTMLPWEVPCEPPRGGLRGEGAGAGTMRCSEMLQEAQPALTTKAICPNARLNIIILIGLHSRMLAQYP